MDIKSKMSGLQHVGIQSGDLAVTERFYNMLGFEKVHTAVSSKGNAIMFMKFGDSMLEFVEDRNPARRDGSVNHISLNVTGDIDELYGELVASGAEVVTDGVMELPVWDNGIRLFTILGPDRERIEFNKML